MKENKMYYLMHRDDVVTMVEIDTVSGNIVKTAPKARQELLPPGGNLSQATCGTGGTGGLCPGHRA